MRRPSRGDNPWKLTALNQTSTFSGMTMTEEPTDYSQHSNRETSSFSQSLFETKDQSSGVGTELPNTPQPAIVTRSSALLSTPSAILSSVSAPQRDVIALMPRCTPAHQEVMTSSRLGQQWSGSNIGDTTPFHSCPARLIPAGDVLELLGMSAASEDQQLVCLPPTSARPAAGASSRTVTPEGQRAQWHRDTSPPEFRHCPGDYLVGWRPQVRLMLPALFWIWIKW